MIQLRSNFTLSAGAITVLQTLQTTVDSKTNFVEQVKEALRLWNGKPNAIFSIVRQTLVDLSISDQICHYCEQNEGTDIEHIYTKSHYPSRCFNWDNYILACGKCNTHEKSDDFAIFDPINSSNIVKLNRQKPDERTKPTTEDGVLINPRAENPLDYLLLNFEPIGKRLIFIPKETNKTSRPYIRADYTIDLLNLNRDQLATARFQAAKYFISRLTLFADVKAATNFDNLKTAIDDFEPINTAILFVEERQNILNSIKTDILHYPHPTVWAEMKRQRTQLPKTNDLFQKVPEALTW
jgi:uncharacterized protein (TIGR02646 family)